MTLAELIPAIVARCVAILAPLEIVVLSYEDPDFDSKSKLALHEKGYAITVAYLTGTNRILDRQYGADLELENHITIVVAEDRGKNQTGKTPHQLAVDLLQGLTVEESPGAPADYAPDTLPIEAEERPDNRLHTYFVNITANTKN